MGPQKEIMPGRKKHYKRARGAKTGEGRSCCGWWLGQESERWCPSFLGEGSLFTHMLTPSVRSESQHACVMGSQGLRWPRGRGRGEIGKDGGEIAWRQEDLGYQPSSVSVSKAAWQAREGSPALALHRRQEPEQSLQTVFSDALPSRCRASGLG